MFSTILPFFKVNLYIHLIVFISVLTLPRAPMSSTRSCCRKFLPHNAHTCPRNKTDKPADLKTLPGHFVLTAGIYFTRLWTVSHIRTGLL